MRIRLRPLSLLQGQAHGLQIAGHVVRLATVADQEACSGLCRRVHGYARAQELLEAIQHQTATVVERGGRIAGCDEPSGALLPSITS